ncbi:MAG: hypothetical protein H6592_11895 [Flavobacteriales bacterium]|nr:hypothetical protein [Flavobacteriales bacterium]
MIRQLSLLLCCFPFIAVHAADSTDSLSALATRLADRIDRLGHPTVAVLGIPEEGEQALTDAVTAEFIYHLANKADGFRLVERAQLDVLLNEQRLSASGLLDEAHAVELGELASASAILAVHVRAQGKREVLVEVKVLHASTGALEGMERTMIDRPAGVERARDSDMKERPSDPVRIDRSPWEMHTGAGLGSFYGGTAPFAQLELLARTGRRGADGVRLAGGFAAGFRFRYMPNADNGLPQQVDFGHLTRGPELDLFGMPQEFSFTADDRNGDVYLVASDDFGPGAQLVSEALAAGHSSAVWEQGRPRSFRADQWSLQLPMRVFLTGADVRGPRPYIEAGLGADMVRIHAEYAVTRIQGRKEGNDVAYSVDQYAFDGPFADRNTNNAFFLNTVFGAGMEWGRISVGVSATHSLHQKILDTSDPFALGKDESYVVHGDPIAIALLHGSALDDERLSPEMATTGALRFGATAAHDLDKQRIVMDRFLDRWQWQATLSFRLF